MASFNYNPPKNMGESVGICEIPNCFWTKKRWDELSNCFWTKQHVPTHQPDIQNRSIFHLLATFGELTHEGNGWQLNGIDTYLVGGFNPSDKYVSSGTAIPNWMENNTCSKPPTKQNTWLGEKLFGQLWYNSYMVLGVFLLALSQPRTPHILG